MERSLRIAVTGVFRIEEGRRAERFRSLRAAIVEPPRDTDAEIRGSGGVLAMSTSDDEPCGWVLTPIGKCRIEQEVRGAA